MLDGIDEWLWRFELKQSRQQLALGFGSIIENFYVGAVKDMCKCFWFGEAARTLVGSAIILGILNIGIDNGVRDFCHRYFGGSC